MNLDPLNFQFQKEYEVMSFQISPEGRLRWSALGDLFQEVAWKHADSNNFGRQLFERNLVWILSRFDIRIFDMPAWGDIITVKTSGRGVDRIFALRDFSLEDQSGKVLATATSAWILLDWVSKRPQKPDRVLPSEMFQTLEGSSFTPNKVVNYNGLKESMCIEVRPSDLDMNNHVNNVSFIRWVEDFCAFYKLTMVQLLINYQAEVLLGEKITLWVADHNNKVNLVGCQGGKAVFSSVIFK